MTQKLLNFNPAKNTRRTDLATSKDAAHLNREERLAHAAQILDYVRKCPGQCSSEIAQSVQIERHETSRRLSDLERDGFVRKGQSRRSAVGLTLQSTWYATEKSK